MKYFTSDWHLGEDRLGIEEGKPNLFYRPFKTTYENDMAIVTNFINSDFKDGDELWHLGDVMVTPFPKYLSWIRDRYPNSKFNLIIGNYDEDKLYLLGKYFDSVVQWDTTHIGQNIVFLNHYPIKCRQTMDRVPIEYKPFRFAITGHIHGLWKVQKKMINVGVDAWHFKPVSEKEIEFCMIACEKYYDNNVFPY